MVRKIIDVQKDKYFLLSGRHECECQAYKHKLINNCLKCGRIICAQEGSGPCFFCGNLVCTNEEQEILNRASKASDKLLIKLMSDEGQAIANKERLLNYDKTTAKRTVVIDDQSDYFSSENAHWLNPIERATMQEMEAKNYDQKHGSRFGKAKEISINFKNLSISETVPDNNFVNEISKQKKKDLVENTVPEANSEMIDHNIINNYPMPKFIETNTTKVSSKISLELPKIRKIQDDDFNAAFDQRKCLSMHQPYASLLIYGIKKEEGRSWPTAHRGRLWIASTGKPIDPNEVKSLEQIYQTNSNEYIKFPDVYPTSCILGCINIDDCLTQEAYRDLEPNGMSESPYVWICSDPKRLKLKIPIQGKPKIYDLDAHTWRAAMKNLIL